MTSAEPRFLTRPHPGDLHAWQVLRPLLDGRPYLPFSVGAMRIGGLVHICNTIVHTDPAQVVECGAGVSTIVLARLLAQCGRGTLTALEHDPAWAARVGASLADEGLEGVARVVLAPLEGEPEPWYAEAGVAQLPDAIDLLVVDGPPADRPELALARRPALGRLAPRLAPGATVVLDDIGRAGEQEVLVTWEATTDWRFERLEDEAIAVGTRPSRTPPGPAAAPPPGR